MVATPFTGEIYLHWNPITDRGYVGQTINGVSNRWRDQVKVTRWPHHGGYRYPLSRAIRKHGKEVFEHQVLSVSHTKTALDNLEKVWIILLQTREQGYNLATGGEGNPGLNHTAIAKAKMSKNRKGKALGNRNAVGHRCSVAHKQAISQKLTGKKFSAEHNEKIRQARTGVKRPDVVAANLRRWSDPAACLKQSKKQKSLGSHLLIRDAHGHILGRKEPDYGTPIIAE